MQTFSSQPTDSELACLLDPEGRASCLKVAVTQDRMIVSPGGIPMSLAVASLALPMCGIVVFRVLELIGNDQFWLMIILGCLCGGTLLVIVALLNWDEARRGDFLVLDRTLGTIALLRLNQSLSKNQIEEFVEVHAWHTTRDGLSRESDWLCELSVVVRCEGGGFVRYPAATSASGDVRKCSHAIANFFDVPLHVLKLNWSMRRRLKRLEQSHN